MVDTRRRTLLLLLITSLTLALCLYWLSLGIIQRTNALTGFILSNKSCLVVNATLERTKQEHDHRNTIGISSFRFRGVVYVRDYINNGGRTNITVKASRYGDLNKEWIDDEDDVKKYVGEFKKGQRYTCYYKEKDVKVVKMTKHALPDRFWSLRILATCILMLLFISVVVFTFRKEVLPERFRKAIERVVRELLLEPGINVIRLRALECDIDKRDVRKAISTLNLNQEEIKSKLEEGNWSCPICLESKNEDFEDTLDASVVDLPCGNSHFVHAGCIFNWLSNGGSTCPLCNYELASYIRAASQSSLRNLRRHLRSTSRLVLERNQGNRGVSSRDGDNGEVRIQIDPCE